MSGGGGTTDRRLCLAVAALAVLIYLPALQNGFVDWDDPIYVTANKQVAAGLTGSSIRYAFTTFDSNNWIPLTWLSYELDATLFGVNPAAFHAVNVFWHACNVGLLCYAIQRLTGSRYRSTAVALLFAVHPLHVESVAWVSERKDLLSTCALILALLAYQRYAAKPSVGRYLLVFTLMALGLLAKSMLVTLPVLLLIVDVWPLRRGRWSNRPIPEDALQRSPWQLLFEKLPLVALSLADGLITMSAQTSAMTGSNVLPFATRAGNAICGYVWYLRKTFWPTGLCAFYHHPLESLSPLVVGSCAVLLVVLTVWVAICGRQRPHLLFGWAWFVIALLPVIGLVQVGTQAYADRYAYIPHIGLFVAIVWELHRLLGFSTVGKRLNVALIAVAIAGCTVLTTLQIPMWHDNETLWARAIHLDPYNAIAQLQLGQIALRKEDWDAAEIHYSNVMVRRPSDPDAILNLGFIHHQRKQWDLAAEYYLWLLRVSPRNPAALQNLSSLPPRPPITTRRTQDVIDKNKLGLKHARTGEFDEALRYFAQAAKLDPSDVISQNNSATALEELNRPDEARAYYEQALRAKPLDVEARHGLDRIDKRAAARKEE